MKNIILMAVLSCVMIWQANAQKYYHGIGAQVNYTLYNFEYETSSGLEYGNHISGLIGVAYKASLVFDSGNNRSFGVTAQPFLSFRYFEETGFYLISELPVMAEYYFGNLEDLFVSFGAGFSYSRIAKLNDFESDIFGPKAQVSGQFFLNNRPLQLNVGYVYGVNNRSEFVVDKKSVLSLGVIFPIGVY